MNWLPVPQWDGTKPIYLWMLNLRISREIYFETNLKLTLIKYWLRLWSMTRSIAKLQEILTSHVLQRLKMQNHRANLLPIKFNQQAYILVFLSYIPPTPIHSNTWHIDKLFGGTKKWVACCFLWNTAISILESICPWVSWFCWLTLVLTVDSNNWIKGIVQITK